LSTKTIIVKIARQIFTDAPKKDFWSKILQNERETPVSSENVSMSLEKLLHQ